MIASGPLGPLPDRSTMTYRDLTLEQLRALEADNDTAAAEELDRRLLDEEATP